MESLQVLAPVRGERGLGESSGRAAACEQAPLQGRGIGDGLCLEPDTGLEAAPASGRARALSPLSALRVGTQKPLCVEPTCF